MRPQAGGDSQQPPRPRKRSSADLGPPTSASATPTAFMLGTEKELEAYFDDPQGKADVGRSSLPADSVADSTYGVRSLDESELMAPEVAESREAAGREHGNEETAMLMARRRSTIRPGTVHRRGSLGGLSTVSVFTNESPSPGKDKGKGLLRDYSDVPLSQPLTPLSRASPGPLSDAPPSPRSSILHSDDDLETGSQAILSSGEEDASEPEKEDISEANALGLQLVMPSLMMPSRRPFTERGKRLGRLRVLLTGATGVGKTSLIKSIVQTCNEIVHIDSQSATSSQVSVRRSARRRPSTATSQITEIYGSTKPYPGWWSQVEDSQTLRRRKSGSEEVLERNVCFVDTPGYEKNSNSTLESIETTLQYIQTQMSHAISPAAMHDSELLGVLGGSGGTQVDVILFLFESEPTPIELEYYERLSKLAYVIPLLAKSDLIPDDDQAGTRFQITQALKSSNSHIKTSLSHGLSEIYSVCSSPSNDLENMDASLLMASGYVEPLEASELPTLLDHLFDPEHAALMKHVAAKKLVLWRQSSSQYSLESSPSPLKANMFAPTLPRSSSGSSGRNASPLSPVSAALTYTSSRLLDHKQREERMAQANLGNWADNLRRNLATERVRFEKLANEERRQWLEARLNECIFDGKIAGKGMSGQRSPAWQGRLRRSRREAKDLDLDPLSLMRWRSRVLGALQVVGGVSVVSALALCVARVLDVDLNLIDELGVTQLYAVFGQSRH